jgi:hypothetical protein
MFVLIDRAHKFFINYWRLIVFNLILVLIFFPITYQQTVMFDTSDYRSKLNVAMYFNETGKLVDIYQGVHTPLFYFGTLFYKEIFGFSYAFGQIITILLCYPLMGNIIFSQVKKVNEAMDGWKGMLVTLGIIIAGPLFFLVFLDHKFYFGYVGFALYHNPTIIMLRPFALILWIITISNFFKEKLIIWDIFIGLGAMIIATIAKPSYTICIFPGMGIVFLWQLLTHRKINWKYALIVFFVPAILVIIRLPIETLKNLIIGDNRIIFAPFRVIHWMSRYMVFKYLLSIIFPLSLSLIFLKKVVKDRAMVIAWLIFGIGTSYGYLLTQTGTSEFAANFLWSTQITLFILFFQSIIFLLSRKFTEHWQKTSKLVLWSIFTAQVIFGIIYYVHCFINPIYI